MILQKGVEKLHRAFCAGLLGAPPVSAPTHLFVGLGNPGPHATAHRHNVGFRALDAVSKRYDFGKFRQKKRFDAQVAQGQIGDITVVGLKPQTYMNESGRAVSAALSFYKLRPSAVFVFHDEIDLVAGKVRAKFGGGIAGHNGLRSIRTYIGPEFFRIRIGVGHPGDRERVTKHVLSAFERSDEKWLNPTLSAISDALPDLVSGDTSSFMSRISLLTQTGTTSNCAKKNVKPESNTNGI